MILSRFINASVAVQAQHLIPRAALYGNAVTLTTSQGPSAYPRGNYLSNGHILAAYTAFLPGPENLQQLTLITSIDDGDSWKPTGTAATKPQAKGTLDNPYPLQLPSGRVLLAFRNHDWNSHSHTWSFYRITLTYSDDLGSNWQFLSDAVVVTATAESNGVWEPFLRSTPDGVLQLYYSRELAADVQINAMIYSTDGGRTWSKKETIVSQAPRSRDGMLGVVELPTTTSTSTSTSLLAVFESKTYGSSSLNTFALHSVSSPDDGLTWTHRRQIYAPQDPSRNAGAPQIIRVGGTLVVSFMTDEDFGEEQLKWPDVASAKVLFSTDRGETWMVGSRAVFDGTASWPGLLALRNDVGGHGREGFLYLAGSGRGVKSQKVVL